VGSAVPVIAEQETSWFVCCGLLHMYFGQQFSNNQNLLDKKE